MQQIPSQYPSRRLKRICTESASKYKFRRCKDSGESAIAREMELYRWHLDYFQMSMPNSWSNISKKIPGTTPAMLKNIFYSHAMSSIKKIIAKVKLESCDEVECIRISYFFILAREYMQYNLVNTLRNDHFMRLLSKYSISVKELEAYEVENNISRNRDTIRKRIFAQLSEEYVPVESNIKCMFNTTLSLPIDKCKKLMEPNHAGLSMKKKKLNTDMVEALSYFLEYQYKMSCVSFDEREETLEAGN